MQEYNLWLEINIKQLKENLNRVVQAISGDVGVMAIVKANAYGHGMVRVAESISDMISYFGVSSFQEGDALRRAGMLTPILILGSLLPYEFEQAIADDLTLSVSDLKYVEAVNACAEKMKKKAKVHIVVDTGMGRWGIPYTEAYEKIKKIVKLPFIDVEGMCTHFPIADNAQIDYTERQIDLFSLLIDELAQIEISFRYIHAANSAGIMNFNASHFNLVRPGIMMYGYMPRAALHAHASIKPVLSVKARVCLIKDFKAKRGVSYGRSYITPKPTRIAVVPIGYGHGYPYALSKKAHVIIKEKRYPVAGNVSMDYIMVDIGRDDTITVGDEVIILGSSGNECIDAYELASLSQTIPYEIITNLSAHLARVYITDDK